MRTNVISATVSLQSQPIAHGDPAHALSQSEAALIGSATKPTTLGGDDFSGVQNRNVSSVQKGKVTESLVACTLVLASGGRLSPFTPISDDCGVDLIVLDKTTRCTLSMQVKSRIKNALRPTVKFNVQKATLSQYVVAVLLDPANATLTRSWLIPMVRVPGVSVVRPDKYVLSPNTSRDSRDRYASFRLDTPKELAEAILRAVNAADGASVRDVGNLSVTD